MATLVRLSTPGQLQATAAASFERTREALSRAGIDSGTGNALHATRTWQDQADIFRDHYQINPTQYAPGLVDRRIWQGRAWYRRPGRAAAAIPGTSNHGNGYTVDWQNLGGYTSTSWKKAAPILRAHGWTHDEGWAIREPWHWTYVASRDTQSTPEEPEMELTDRHELTPATQRSLKEATGLDREDQPVSLSLSYATGAFFETQMARREARASEARILKALDKTADGMALEIAQLLSDDITAAITDAVGAMQNASAEEQAQATIDLLMQRLSN